MSSSLVSGCLLLCCCLVFGYYYKRLLKKYKISSIPINSITNDLNDNRNNTIVSNTMQLQEFLTILEMNDIQDSVLEVNTQELDLMEYARQQQTLSYIQDLSYYHDMIYE